MFPTAARTDNADLTNVTVLSSPRPQASSTVERKSTFRSKLPDTDWKTFNSSSILNDTGEIRRLEESSLGLIDNISLLLNDTSKSSNQQNTGASIMDSEREFARRLLQKCSGLEGPPMIIDADKENDANLHNVDNMSSLLDTMQHGNSTIQCSKISQPASQEDSTLREPVNKTGSASVFFEPNEITARSSGLSGNLEKRVSNHSVASGISFDATTAELLAQFDNEEFQPGSQIASQLSADEISWQQNCSYAIPATTNAEKEYLDLSCFSGIIGDIDLSIQSCAGRKVSVGEFFKRKCGNIGELTQDTLGRPSFGLYNKSPKRDKRPTPLVDTTLTSEDSTVQKDKDISIYNTHTNTNAIKDVEEHSIMSLSSIAQVLQDIDNGTPRKLVDQLIMAKKKRKQIPVLGENVASDTYTLLPASRKSMPITPSTNTDMPERNTGLFELSAKLSLDSKVLSELTESKPKIQRVLSFTSELCDKEQKVSVVDSQDSMLKNNKISNDSLTNKLQEHKSFVQVPNVEITQQKSEIQSIPCKIKQSISSERQSSISENGFSDQKKKIEKKDSISGSAVQCKSEPNTSTLSQSSQSRSPSNKHAITAKTQELCMCAIGIRRETDIDLLNNSDKWIVCSITLHQIQGDKENIDIKLPEDILIRPATQQSVKINILMKTMGNPIIAVLNIAASDMVTKLRWNMKTIVCFVPEEPDINIVIQSEKQELDFQHIPENCIMSLPVMLENRSKVDIPVKFFILQHGANIFTIDSSNEARHSGNKLDEMKYLVLKPQEQRTVNVQCKGLSLGSTTDIPSTQPNRFEGKLVIQIQNEDNCGLVIKEVPLMARVGISKIEVETKLPIIIPKRESRLLEIINTGSIAVLVSANIIQSEHNQIAVKDFTVKPNNLLLQCSEKGCFTVTYKPQHSDTSERKAIVKLTAGNNSYHCSVIGEKDTTREPIPDNYLRCETPEQRDIASSPSSPHSVTSNRSRISGRNSPGSSASGSTVAGEEIPIKATHASLVWNCIKAGKHDVKEFTIRNMSTSKIKLLASISDNNKSFKFLRERQSIGTNMVLSLQSMESRVLSIVFNPFQIGAAAGKITFRHYEPKRENSGSGPTKLIFLYGYGGSSKVEISETFKDASGKMWLSLGTLNSGGFLRTRIKLQNNGNLRSYAKINLVPKAIYPAVTSSWRIHPTEILLNPRDVQWITLEFNPRKEDLSRMQRRDVSHVGTLTITHGDEPTRWRIRRLYNKLKASGELKGKENEAFRNIIHPICTIFPGEELIPDLYIIRDSIRNLSELCRCGIHQQEIILTMEIGADETLSILQDSADDSQMFQSLYSDESHVFEGSGESFLPSTAETEADNTLQQETCNEYFTVNPSEIRLIPPSKSEATVMILSSSKVAQPFETALSNTELLQVVPAEGMIPTGRGFPLKVKCKRSVDRNFEAILQVYTENDRQDVLIRVTK